MKFYERNKFFSNIPVERVVHARPITRPLISGKPTFIVDAVDGVEDILAVLNKIFHGFDHLEIFVFIKSSTRGRKDDDRLAPMPINLKGHDPIQM
jgi:hypothetical protein